MDAAAYLAGVGSIHRFHRAAEVWAFAGYDPIADGSGDYPKRVGHISKHGPSAFRDTLFQMGYRVAQNHAPVSLTFLEAFDRGSGKRRSRRRCPPWATLESLRPLTDTEHTESGPSSLSVLQ